MKLPSVPRVPITTSTGQEERRTVSRVLQVPSVLMFLVLRLDASKWGFLFIRAFQTKL